MTNVHLLVLCHGMWGSTVRSGTRSASMSFVRITEFSLLNHFNGLQEHLAALAEAISELYPKSAVSNSDNQSKAQYDLDVLTAESNQEKYTYDGIDWGGERLVAEVCFNNTPPCSPSFMSYTCDGMTDERAGFTTLQIRGKIASIQEQGDRKVTRFSISGYSLGGLLARYVIGALYANKFFDTIEPVNFTTIATPHLGIPKYPSFFSTMVRHFSSFHLRISFHVRIAYTTLLSFQGTQIGPRLLGRTGLQFYGVDKSNGPDSRPLLEIMADHSECKRI